MISPRLGKRLCLARLILAPPQHVDLNVSAEVVIAHLPRDRLR
jgi:hypothetical protein